VKPSEWIAMAFHDASERLAPGFGWETQARAHRPWTEIPIENRRVVIAVVEDLLARRVIQVG
jgi:hypothetical protein